MMQRKAALPMLLEARPYSVKATGSLLDSTRGPWMSQYDRSFHEFGWSCSWVVSFKSRTDVLCAFLPPPWHALDANGKNCETSSLINMQSKKMFPILNAQRGKCFVHMSSEYIERNQQIHAKQNRTDYPSAEKNQRTCQEQLCGSLKGQPHDSYCQIRSAPPDEKCGGNM